MEVLGSPAESLVGAKEKSLVFANGSAHRSTKLVLDQRGCVRLEEITCIEGTIAVEFKQASMKLVGTRLCDHIDHGARRTPIFGSVIVADDSKLLNGIRIRNIVAIVAERSGIVATVQQPVAQLFAGPINVDPVDIECLSVS